MVSFLPPFNSEPSLRRCKIRTQRVYQNFVNGRCATPLAINPRLSAFSQPLVREPRPAELVRSCSAPASFVCGEAKPSCPLNGQCQLNTSPAAQLRVWRGRNPRRFGASRKVSDCPRDQDGDRLYSKRPSSAEDDTARPGPRCTTDFTGRMRWSNCMSMARSSLRRRSVDAAALVLARRAGLDRHEIRLRRGAVRRLHSSCRRRGDARLRDSA